MAESCVPRYFTVSLLMVGKEWWSIEKRLVRNESAFLKVWRNRFEEDNSVAAFEKSFHHSQRLFAAKGDLKSQIRYALL